MKDKQLLIAGTGDAAWGYFFLYFDFNLGSISILPSFVGFVLFYKAIKGLKELRRELALLEPLAVLLLAWHLTKWLLSWVGMSLDGLWQPFGLIITLASIYFHFQFLTDFAALARQYLPETFLSERILRWRTVQTVIITGVYLMAYVSGFESGWLQYVAVGMIVAQLFAMVMLMAALFAMRKEFRNLEYQTEEE